MATKKRQIAFYADDFVADWYAALAPGEGTKKINDYLHWAIEQDTTTLQKVSAAETKIEDIAYRQESDAETLKRCLDLIGRLLRNQETIYAHGSCGPGDQIRAEYKAIEHALAVAQDHHVTRGL